MTTRRKTVAQLSVQQAPDNQVTPSHFSVGFIHHRDILLPWGNRGRDWQLRQLAYNHRNNVFQGAEANLSKKTAGTPWEIAHGKESSSLFQDVLLEADLNAGWDVFIQKTLFDYMTTDFGAVIEIIGAGNPEQPLVGPVVGIANLDSLRCVATGDIDIPVVYVNQKGEVHKLHNTRVHRFIDNPTPDQHFHDLGLCALSRVIMFAQTAMLMAQYQNEKLSNLPPEGLIVVNGVSGDQFEQAMKQVDANRQKDGSNIFNRVAHIDSIDPEQPISIEMFAFSELPDHYDHDTYSKWNVIHMANGIGVDVQEISPLMGQALGTGTQSVILDKKGQGKQYNHILRLLERFINTKVLPPDLEFKFKHQDEEQDKLMADKAAVWSSVADSTTVMSDQEKRLLLANQVPAFNDVLTDEAGLLRFPDDDILGPDGAVIGDGRGAPTTGDVVEGEIVGDVAVEKDEERPQIFAYHIETRTVKRNEARAQLKLPPQTDDTADRLQDLKEQLTVGNSAKQMGYSVEQAAEMTGLPPPTEEEPEPAPTLPPQFGAPVAELEEGSSHLDNGNTSHLDEEEDKARRKDFNSTYDKFVDRATFMIGVFQKDRDRSRFGIQMRKALKTFGTDAFGDGLELVGVPAEEISKDDKNIINQWLADQSGFVTAIGKELLARDKDLPPIDAESRAQLWGNKSLTDIHQKGLLSAGANAMMEFSGSDGKESCRDCKRLKGQRHRMVAWVDSGWLPRSDKLFCSGFNCQHVLKPVLNKRARGRF